MAKKHKSPKSKPAPPVVRRQSGEWEIWVSKRPVLTAVLLFALLTVVFFGILHPALFSPDKMIYGTDTMGAGVFFRSFYADFWREYQTMPLWEPYIHGGMPFVDAMHGDIFYPAALLQIILPVTYALGLKLILHVFLAGLLMFLFLWDWGGRDDWRSAMFGGILYMFTPCLVSLFYPGHDGKIYVTALLPLAFLFLRRGVVTRRWSAFFAFGLVYAFLILTAHVQMAYYASWALGLYFLFLLGDEHRFRPKQIVRPVIGFVLVIVLAAGASAIQWLSPYSYLRDFSQRIQHSEEKGFEWSSSWSMHFEEAGALLVPEFPGDNLVHQPPATYWGQNYFKLNSEAVGVIAVFLALTTMIALRRREVYFFGGLSLIALLYALGSNTPLFTLSYYLVPGVQKFRAPSMINFLFAFGLVVLAARGLQHLRQSTAQGPAEKQYFKTALILVGLYTLITLVISAWGEGFFATWIDIFQSAPDPRKQQAMRANVPQVVRALWISTVLLWAGLGLLWLRINRALKSSLLFGGLAVLALVDLWRFDSRFVHVVDPDNYYRRSALVDHLKQSVAADGPTRTFPILDAVPDNYLALFGLEEVSMSAMHGNHLLSYDNFSGRHEPSQNLLRQKFLDLLNVRQVISPVSAEVLIDQANKAQNRDFLTLGRMLAGWPGSPQQVAGKLVYTNPHALPRVTGFFGYQVIEDHEAVLTEIKKSEFRHRNLLLLEQEVPGFSPTTNPTDLPPFIAGRMVENTINEFTIEIDMPADGLVFLSENFYPAWHAEENGASLVIYRANYTFRAVQVKAGSHTIRFYFDNPQFNRGKLMSGVCFIVLIVGLLATWRRKKKEEPPVTSGQL